MSMRRPLGRVGSSAGGRVAARGEGSCQQEWLLTEQVAGAHTDVQRGNSPPGGASRWRARGKEGEPWVCEGTL